MRNTLFTIVCWNSTFLATYLEDYLTMKYEIIYSVFIVIIIIVEVLHAWCLIFISSNLLSIIIKQGRCLKGDFKGNRHITFGMTPLILFENSSVTNLFVLFQVIIHFSKTLHLFRILLSAHSTGVLITKAQIGWLSEVDQ